MCHAYNYVGGFIAGIRKLYVDDELVVLAIMHYHSENEANYIRFQFFFKNCYPNISISEKCAVSGDGDNGISASVGQDLPNDTFMICIDNLLKKLSTNKLDPVRRQLELTAYKPTKKGFPQAFSDL